MFRTKATLTIIIILCISSSTVFAHPCEEYMASDKPEAYGQATREQIGDLTFDYEYPAWESLTDAERYMVAGGQTAEGAKVFSWSFEVCKMVMMYSEKFGSIPVRFTPDMLVSISGHPELITERRLSWFSSPLSNEYPLLTSEEFSPGSFYIYKLTDSEVREAAKHDAILLAVLEDNFSNPDTGEPIHAELGTGVYYYRMYGLTGVLQAGLLYSWGHDGMEDDSVSRSTVKPFI